MTAFGNSVQRLREAKHLSLGKVAGQITTQLKRKVYPSTIQRIERGESDPDQVFIRALEAVLGVDEGELLALADWNVGSVQSPAEEPFGVMIRRMRKEKGYTAKQLSAMVTQGPNGARLRPSYLNGIESGRYLPSVDVIRGLAQALDAEEVQFLERSRKLDKQLLQERFENDPVVASILHALATKYLSENQVLVLQLALQNEITGDQVRDIARIFAR